MTDVVKELMTEESGSAEQDMVEEKRECLAILASLGETKEYLKKEMSLGDINKLEQKDVEKYYRLYQAVSSKQVSGALILGGIKMVSRIVSFFLPIDDPDLLTKDLQEDQLIHKELASLAGLLVLKGGRFVALASALFHVASHVRLGGVNDGALPEEQKELSSGSQLRELLEKKKVTDET